METNGWVSLISVNIKKKLSSFVTELFVMQKAPQMRVQFCLYFNIQFDVFAIGNDTRYDFFIIRMFFATFSLWNMVSVIVHGLVMLRMVTMLHPI